MSNQLNIDLDQANADLNGKTAEQIVAWALAQGKNPIITTNFRPYEVVLLDMVAKQKPDITVLFVDSGYNTDATYRHAQEVIKRLNLNVITYLPKQTAKWRDVEFNGVPSVNNPAHAKFTEQVKLEPFGRALKEIAPDVWINAIRKDQTEFRQSLDVLSESKDGVLKVAPLFHWTESDLEKYLADNNLPNEHDYFDPTKVEENRECGLHTQL
ncbi:MULTISPECIES: phosphoadenosine phosphosulfate reductase family protein [unclassified Moraxella]|uniref:phosphoadenosine phosphosulfate reductase domain-containing protein n=1 Tax=unclassified Moraxella TaxID=2685852 RepID=UPI003AF6ABDC